MKCSIVQKVDAMSFQDKILTALKTAKNHLENSMTAKTKNNEELFKNAIWHAAAELEYALFFFSMIFENESQRQKWKANPKLKKADLNSMLNKTQELLNEAEKLVGENMLEAYKNAYLARHYMLKIQGDLAKKKREKSSKKK